MLHTHIYIYHDFIMIYLASTQAFTSRPGHSQKLSGFSGGRLSGTLGGARCPGGLRGRRSQDTPPEPEKNAKVLVRYKYVPSGYVKIAIENGHS